MVRNYFIFPKCLLYFLSLIPFLFSNTCIGQADKAVMENVVGTTWIRSYEEDDGETTAYREKAYAFPPSRGREGFKAEANGAIIKYVIAPTDGILEKKGNWELADGKIVAKFGEGKQREKTWTLKYISLQDGLLKVEEEN